MDESDQFYLSSSHVCDSRSTTRPRRRRRAMFVTWLCSLVVVFYASSLGVFVQASTYENGLFTRETMEEFGFFQQKNDMIDTCDSTAVLDVNEIDTIGFSEDMSLEERMIEDEEEEEVVGVGQQQEEIEEMTLTVPLTIDYYKGNLVKYKGESMNIALDRFFDQMRRHLTPKVLEAIEIETKLDLNRTSLIKVEQKKPLFVMDFYIEGNKVRLYHFKDVDPYKNARLCCLAAKMTEGDKMNKTIEKVALLIHEELRRVQKLPMFTLTLSFNGQLDELVHYEGWTSLESAIEFLHLRNYMTAEVESKDSKEQRVIQENKNILTRLIDERLDEMLLEFSSHQTRQDVPILSNQIRVNESDIQDLNTMYLACVNHNNSIVSWQNKHLQIINRNDADLLDKLQDCPDVDVYHPELIRGHGFCEDTIAYLKFLQSRLLPKWVFEDVFINDQGKNVTYFELCPRTPTIFINHHHDGWMNSPLWPTEKLVYLTPNIEMYELKPADYRRVDLILCKNADCEMRLNKWFAQHGNPRNTTVLYTRHTSSDPTLYAKEKLDDEIKPKDFENLKFVHTAGRSPHKGTHHIFECWLSRTDNVSIDIYMMPELFETMYKKYEDKIANKSATINLHLEFLNFDTFGQVLAESSVLLCPSRFEGYGHYINHARASSSVVITSDAPPMNELITGTSTYAEFDVEKDSGILVQSTKKPDTGHVLGGFYSENYGLKDVSGLTSDMRHIDLCDAVDFVLNDLSATERKQLGQNARAAYLEDMQFFANQMQIVKAFNPRQ